MFSNKAVKKMCKANFHCDHELSGEDFDLAWSKFGLGQQILNVRVIL
jgi:hypothetical protein